MKRYVVLLCMILLATLAVAQTNLSLPAGTAMKVKLETMSAPVGHAIWQGAALQCLQTSLIISHRPATGSASSASRSIESDATAGAGCCSENCSTKVTCRQVVADSMRVLS